MAVATTTATRYSRGLLAYPTLPLYASVCAHRAQLLQEYISCYSQQHMDPDCDCGLPGRTLNTDLQNGS